jgi:hypothetical protein
MSPDLPYRKKWSLEKLAFPTLMLKRDSFDVTLQSVGGDVDLDLAKTDDGILLGSGTMTRSSAGDALDMACTPGGDCFGDEPEPAPLCSAIDGALWPNDIVLPSIGPSIWKKSSSSSMFPDEDEELDDFFLASLSAAGVWLSVSAALIAAGLVLACPLF